MRPILTGVMVQAEGERLTMVATDSYRLSVKHASLEQPVAQPLEANVPARALRELARIISAEGADEVEIAMPRNQAIFRAAGVTLSSRLIEGQFPSWRQLIPETFEHEVRLPREEFLEIARRISQLAQRNAPLRLAFAEGELTVAAETPEIGDASEGMPAPYTGEPLEIAFNPQYLVEGVESVGSEEIALQLSSPLRPGSCARSTATTSRYLVMPIRLNQYSAADGRRDRSTTTSPFATSPTRRSRSGPGSTSSGGRTGRGRRTCSSRSTWRSPAARAGPATTAS